jgi:hypothetical protein
LLIASDKSIEDNISQKYNILALSFGFRSHNKVIHLNISCNVSKLDFILLKCSLQTSFEHIHLATSSCFSLNLSIQSITDFTSHFCANSQRSIKVFVTVLIADTTTITSSVELFFVSITICAVFCIISKLPKEVQPNLRIFIKLNNFIYKLFLVYLKKQKIKFSSFKRIKK